MLIRLTEGLYVNPHQVESINRYPCEYKHSKPDPEPCKYGIRIFLKCGKEINWVGWSPNEINKVLDEWQRKINQQTSIGERL